MKNILCDEGTINLAEGILRQAKEDWIKSILLTDTTSKNGKRDRVINGVPVPVVRAECERFFKSDWFGTLTLGKIDSDWAMRTILEEALERYDELVKTSKDKTARKRKRESAKNSLKKMRPRYEIVNYCSKF